ncbi:hypothetical protein [Microbacterium sp. NPDC089695]|uniref:hypothetical protein n=1 Tax=Microbacterium sp. NPDC089695 TaxID=3364198 RepID=UPI003825D9F1
MSGELMESLVFLVLYGPLLLLFGTLTLVLLHLSIRQIVTALLAAHRRRRGRAFVRKYNEAYHLCDARH